MLFFIESIQFVNLFLILFIHLLYLICRKILCFNCLRGPHNCGVDGEKNFGTTFFTHITKRLSFCSILINYESVNFFLKFSPFFFEVF